MADRETIKIEIGDEVKKSCTLISSKQVGPQVWEATVRCPDGSEKKAQAANKNEAKALACLECDGG